jgi:hypothetical protein
MVFSIFVWVIQSLIIQEFLFQWEMFIPYTNNKLSEKQNKNMRKKNFYQIITFQKIFNRLKLYELFIIKIQ